MNLRTAVFSGGVVAALALGLFGSLVAVTVRAAEPAATELALSPGGLAIDAVDGALPPPALVPSTLEVAAGNPALFGPRVKNVILLIGDGMGPQQVGLLSQYARHGSRSTAPNRTSAIEQLMNAGTVGVVMNDPHGAIVVDSAAAATQLATGQYAGSEMIGVNYQGEPAETVVEIAKKLGKSAGLVTDTRVTHATPAAFAAHQRNRSMENEIAVDMLANQVDVMLGGGLRNWVPEAINNRESTAHAALLQMTGGVYRATSKRKDNRNLLLEARGEYALVFDRFALERVKSGRVLGLFADSEMNDALCERAEINSHGRIQPTLVEITDKALELLSANSDGFFLMVEGGQIDWAGHNNDAGTLLHELLRFDAAVRRVLEWAADRDDTLVLVTADHETGSFGFSYSGRPLPEPRRLPGSAFSSSDLFEPNFNYAAHEVLDRLYDQTKSFFTIVALEFDELPPAEQTPEKLMEMVNAASAVKITLEDAAEVLNRAPNRNYVAGHPYLNLPTVPAIRDFEAFYVYGDNSRMNLLGRKMAAAQSVVWGTGTHTSTPVLVGAWGPEAATAAFSGVMHQTDLGQRMIELVRTGVIASPVDAARKPK